MSKIRLSDIGGSKGTHLERLERTCISNVTIKIQEVDETAEQKLSKEYSTASNAAAK